MCPLQSTVLLSCLFGNTGALLVIVTGSISVAVALPSVLILLVTDVASKVTFAGGVSLVQ